MSNYDYRGVISPNGRVRFHGIGTGPMTVHARRTSSDGDFLIVKEEGHKYWSGVGQPWAYAPASFHIYEIRAWQERGDGAVNVGLRQILEFPVKGKDSR